jgi:carboxyl-terminal processing protease
MRKLFHIFMCAGLVLLVEVARAADNAARLSDYQREAGQLMLKQLRRDIEEHHYDSKFKGLKLGELVETASARIAQAKSNAEVFRAIAGVTRAFNDSHTVFQPPRWGFNFDYGWRAFPSGKACLVYRVKRGSDAERQGLKVGDQLLAINGAAVSADMLRAWQYLLFAIEPLQSMKLTVASPGEAPRELVIATRVTERERNLDIVRDLNVLLRRQGDLRERGRNVFEEFDGVLVWRLKHFSSDAEITDGLKRIHGRDKLVLDLRGNGGGQVEHVLRDTKLGVERQRDKTVPLTAELRREKPWQGKLAVLIDRNSGSGAELLAAAVQQNGRGLLLGDRSAGAVQVGRVQVNKVGVDRVVMFATMVATAEFELEGGRKIEGVGVQPDFLMPLSSADLAARRDPVLAKALKQLGVTRTPEQLTSVCWVFDATTDEADDES